MLPQGPREETRSAGPELEPQVTVNRTDRFRITGYAPEPTVGSADIVAFAPQERLARALKGLGMSWLVAAGTIFIPVGHFLLVPGFFLFGIYVFVSRFRATELTRDVRGPCPDCGREQRFDVSGRWSLPRSLDCTECGRALRATSEL